MRCAIDFFTERWPPDGTHLPFGISNDTNQTQTADHTACLSGGAGASSRSRDNQLQRLRRPAGSGRIRHAQGAVGIMRGTRSSLKQKSFLPARRASVIDPIAALR
jgi:hypothetical protein